MSPQSAKFPDDLIKHLGTPMDAEVQQIKEKQEQAKSLGKLEEKVASLEAKQQTLHELVEALQETKIAVARLETKIDALLSNKVH